MSTETGLKIPGRFTQRQSDLIRAYAQRIVVEDEIAEQWQRKYLTNDQSCCRACDQADGASHE